MLADGNQVQSDTVQLEAEAALEVNNGLRPWQVCHTHPGWRACQRESSVDRWSVPHSCCSHLPQGL